MKPPRPTRRNLRACKLFVEKIALIPRLKGEVESCKDAGIPENQISRWRQGRPVRLDHAFLLARELGVSLDWWADDDQAEPPEEASEAMRKCLDAIRTLGAEVAYQRLLQAREVGEPTTSRRQPPNPGSVKPRPKRDNKPIGR